ncbi:hypothetical protein ACGFYQ_07470 [Streptomyces sp. NPDC048258]|uniref:hypothetical protein n=1 Tax=Streptomyces sp. NPDC048258 TaxID=3365527 RepID=UPI003722995E
MAEADWLARLSRLKRLPVVDHEGHLVGTVRRYALLDTLVADDGLRTEIEAMVRSKAPEAAAPGRVSVHAGHVRLTGSPGGASVATCLPRSARSTGDKSDCSTQRRVTTLVSERTGGLSPRPPRTSGSRTGSSEGRGLGRQPNSGRTADVGAELAPADVTSSLRARPCGRDLMGATRLITRRPFGPRAARAAARPRTGRPGLHLHHRPAVVAGAVLAAAGLAPASVRLFRARLAGRAGQPRPARCASAGPGWCRAATPMSVDQDPGHSRTSSPSTTTKSAILAGQQECVLCTTSTRRTCCDQERKSQVSGAGREVADTTSPRSATPGHDRDRC